MPCGTRTSSVPVYQFQHPGMYITARAVYLNNPFISSVPVDFFFSFCYSIKAMSVIGAVSSVGRVLLLHRRCHRFKSCTAHQGWCICFKIKIKFILNGRQILPTPLVLLQLMVVSIKTQGILVLSPKT